MKKSITLVLMAALQLSLAGCSSTNQTSQPAQSADHTTAQEPLRIGVECAYAPYNWEDAEQNAANAAIENHEGFYADGYDVQIAKRLGEEMDRDVVFVKVSWDGLMQSLNQGQIDVIISGMLDSPEHKEAADFSDTYAVNATEYTVLVKKDSAYANAAALADFKGASLLGQKGTRLELSIMRGSILCGP